MSVAGNFGRHFHFKLRFLFERFLSSLRKKKGATFSARRRRATEASFWNRSIPVGKERAVSLAEKSGARSLPSSPDAR